MAYRVSDDFLKWETQLEVCESETDRLNDWERGFIESISDQLTRTGNLSQKQAETLERIYDKVM